MEGRKRENLTFRALYLLGIVFVVDGHASALGNFFEFNGLFRYYSFHLLLFAFGSGYFFRDGAQAHPLAELARRAKRLLLPLYAWNLVYGLGAAFLRRFGGFTLGAPLSAYTLLLAPLTDGQHFAYNLGAWFVFPLFLAGALYLLVRRAAACWGDREGVTFLVCLVPGAVCAELLHRGMLAAPPLFLCRALILLPGYALGVLYRRSLESRDTLPTLPYLSVIVLLRAALCLGSENLAYLLSDCSYFPCGAFGVYAGGALAIAFWLRVARLLAPAVGKSRAALALSRHTYDIMLHHYAGFLALNFVFLLVNALGLGARDFSVLALRTQQGYLYAPGGRGEWALFYVLAGLFLPLLVARVSSGLARLGSRAVEKCAGRRRG